MVSLALLLSLLGCNDYLVAGIEKRQPDILVYPSHIDFGHLESGEETGADSFIVVNTGDEDLIISSPDLVSGNDRYSLDILNEEYTLPAGELLEFEVYYNPETFESNGGYIDILSNDEDEILTTVTLEGHGDAPVMVVSPDEFDYGDISIGCDNEERITIKNEGNLDLTVTEITQMVTQPADILFELGSLPPPPWIIVPGQELDFLVSYIPTDIGSDDSQITILGNDPKTPEVIVTQFGEGDVEQWHQDQWEQDEVPILDILWVIDNSGSMMPFQQNLSTNIGSFMNSFVAAAPDYHMGVITTDRSSFGVIIDNSTQDPETLLASLVVTGTGGSATERGIQMAEQSLSDATYAGPGGTFFRNGAKLIVIFVSDEPDYSYGGWTSYLTFFDNIKPAGDFIPYGVIGDYPSGCQYQYGNYMRTAQAGIGYWDFIDHYGGNWYSICASDWGVQLQDLADEVTARKTFELSELDPIETTIEVTINGQVTVEWTYDPTTNALTFNEGSIPEEGQTVIIDYAVWGCGDE